MEPQILNSNGEPIRSDRCPKCGAGPDQRIPSGGFGRVHLICSGKGCNHEFEELIWQPPTP